MSTEPNPAPAVLQQLVRQAAQALDANGVVAAAGGVVATHALAPQWARRWADTAAGPADGDAMAEPRLRALLDECALGAVVGAEAAGSAGAAVRVWAFGAARAAGARTLLAELAAAAAERIELEATLAAMRGQLRTLERAHTDTAAILESISDGFVAFDRGWRYRYVNGEAERLLRTERDALIGRVAWDVFPDFRDSFLHRQYQRALSLRTPIHFTAPSTDVPGAWFDVRAVPSDEGLAVYFHDATERVRYERALTESEERYRSLFETSRDAIYFTHPNGRFLEVNQSAVALFGYTREELFQLNAREMYLDPAERARFQAAVRREGAVRDFEVRLRRKDGSVIECLLSAAERRSRAGELIGYQGVIHDITLRKRAEQALRQSEEHFRSLIEYGLDVIHLIDADGTTRYISPSVNRLLGYDPEALLGTPAAELVHPSERGYVVDAFRSGAGATAGEALEFRMRHADGSYRTFEGVGRDLTDDPAVAGLIVNSRDVTERKYTEDALRAGEERFRLMVEGSEQVFFYVHDSDHRFEYLSPSVYDVLGYTPAELLGRPYDVLLTESPANAVVHELTDGAIRTGTRASSYICTTRHKDGREITIELVEGPIHRDDEVVGVQGFARDISGRVQVEQRLLHEAMHDALTGLPNRALLVDRVEHVVSRSGRRPDARYAVLFLDLDRFKVINDSLGHLTGDQLLIAFADRLQRCLRPSDTVARLGGDEFTILIEEVGGAADACRVADRIHESLRVPFHVNGHEVFTSTSIGIAIGGAEYESAEALLRDADIAMYRAKALGPGGYKVFDATMHAAAVERLRLETDLRHALDRDELRVLYQPVVRIDTGGVVGFEALLRWEHPKRGLLPPSAFIGAAEETGLIVPIGWKVLSHACRQIAAWKTGAQADRELRMNVNLSAGQFLQPDLLERIDSALDDAGLDGSALALEITESVIMENADFAREMLVELKRRGIQLCIDDFGVGYSSLAYLQNFPVETLKIDRSFISRIGDGGENIEIVRAILTLARDLGMDAVAEGIETRSQWQQLLRLGFRHGQGYYFSQPLEPEAAGALLDRASIAAAPSPEEVKLRLP